MSSKRPINIDSETAEEGAINLAVSSLSESLTL